MPTRLKTDECARERMVGAIDDFLEGRIRAYAFDDAIWKIAAESDDDTVKRVAAYLWLFYSDVHDHAVRLDKPAWDTIQRFRLLLASNLHLEETHHAILHVSQLVGLLGLTGIGILSGPAGLVPSWMAFSGLSAALTKWRDGVEEVLADDDRTRAFPFSGPAQIRLAMGRCQVFRKMRFRPDEGPASLWDTRLPDCLGVFLYGLLRVLGAPLKLIAQVAMPLRVCQVRVVSDPR